MNYSFGLLAYEPKTQKLAAPPVPKLPDGVICLTQDSSGQEKVLLFNFRIGKIDRPEIWMQNTGSVGIQIIFDASEACGTNTSVVQCKPEMSFDGSTFFRSLSCAADGVAVSAGNAFFNLESGDGELSCQTAGNNKSYDLRLRGCKVQP